MPLTNPRPPPTLSLTLPSPQLPKNRTTDALLTGLNDEQREAVTAVDGPLLIVAGAGTGKTRVLANRIVYLVDQVPGLTADRILAVTFSRKAAEEMRHRVEALLGAYADELHVSTFHAFCYQLLQHHGLEIGLPKRLALLGHVEQWMLLRQLLPELGLVHYAYGHDPSGCVEGMLRFINRAKDELVSPSDYAAFLETLAKPDDHLRQHEVQRVYQRYQEALRETGALDFGDLVVEVLRLFRERPALLAQYQEQFSSILVDEFQDTNVAQIALVSTLAARHRNLCVVGDDDQAIYRFRGASYASFLLFQERFPEARTIRLTQNYRSSPPVLASAEQLIQANGGDRYDPDKRLWTAESGGDPVEVVVCQDYQQEARVVVDRIRALHQAMPEPERSYDRIAVLYRAHKHRERIVELLEREEIPHVVIGGMALLEDEAVKDVVACLRVVHNPSDSVSLFRVLTLPFVGLSLADLVQITRAAKQQQRTVYETLRSPRAVTLRPAARRQAKQFLTFLHELHRTGLRDGLEALVRRILEEVSYRPMLDSGIDARARGALMNLSRWYRFVRQYGEAQPGRRALADFLHFLEVYDEAGGEVRDDVPAQSVAGVQLMTIHQAKGLEFDWVIMPGLVQGRFPSRNRPEPVPFPVALMKERLPSGDFHLQEERRLCYVAMTRARRGLILTTVDRPYHRPSVFVRQLSPPPSEWTEAGAALIRLVADPPTLLERAEPELSRAQMVTLAQEQEIVGILQTLKQLTPEDSKAVDAQIARLVEVARSLVTAPQAPELIPPPKELKLSFSQLEAYRYCPLKYQYAYLYQIPTRPTPQMQLGTNIHACLEAFARRLMAGQAPTLDELLAIYEETWRSDGYADAKVEERDKTLGRELVTKYFEVNRETLRPPLFVEKPFLIRVGEAWLQGFIDRIDPQPDGRVEVLDYKTGRPKTTAEVGDRLQLNIYALACRDVLQLIPAQMSFYYLQTNDKLTFPYDEAAILETEQTITTIAQKIHAGAFQPTPEPHKCRFCDFRTICPSSAA